MKPNSFNADAEWAVAVAMVAGVVIALLLLASLQ
jgi:hypothetical protein